MISKANFNVLSGLSFMCKCGSRHDFANSNVLICPDAQKQAIGQAAAFGQKALVIMQNEISSADTLNEIKKKLICIVFKMQQSDKQNFARLLGLLKENEDVRFLIVIGGHNATELGKLVAAKAKLPLVCFINKLDSDSICCPSSLLKLTDKFTLTKTVAPDLVAIDTRLLQQKPNILGSAFGLIAKAAMTLMDKRAMLIARQSEFCPTAQQMIEESIRCCLMLSAQDNSLVAAVAEALVRISFVRGLFCDEDSLYTSVDGLLLCICESFDAAKSAAVSKLLADVYSELLTSPQLPIPANGLRLMDMAKTVVKAEAAVFYAPQESIVLEQNKLQLLAILEKCKAIFALLDADFSQPLQANLQMLKAKMWVSCAVYPFNGLLRTKILGEGNFLL